MLETSRLITRVAASKDVPKVGVRDGSGGSCHAENDAGVLNMMVSDKGCVLSIGKRQDLAPSFQPSIALARLLLKKRAVPAVAEVDVLHIGVAAANGADYLLTWNCRHIANAEMRAKIGAVCRDAGYEPPVICTPEELMGD